MHVNEKTRACRCGTNYPSAAAVFVSEHPGETVFRPLSPYTAGGGRSPPLERAPVLLAGGVSQLGSVHGLQALLALVAQDRQDGVEVGCSAAWHAGRRWVQRQTVGLYSGYHAVVKPTPHVGSPRGTRSEGVNLVFIAAHECPRRRPSNRE